MPRGRPKGSKNKAKAEVAPAKDDVVDASEPMPEDEIDPEDE